MFKETFALVLSLLIVLPSFSAPIKGHSGKAVGYSKGPSAVGTPISQSYGKGKAVRPVTKPAYGQTIPVTKPAYGQPAPTKPSYDQNKTTNALCKYRKPLPPRGGPIIHPSGTMNHEQIRRLWTLKTTDKEVQYLSKLADKYWVPQAIETYFTGWAEDYKGDKEKARLFKANHKRSIHDGEQAYMNALMFQITCDPLYARKVQEIALKWATVNKRVMGKNVPLEMGWFTAALSRALDLIRTTYTDYDQSVERAYMKWMDSLIVPEMRKWMEWFDSGRFDDTGYKMNANWEASISAALLNYGLFKNSPEALDMAERRFKRAMDGATGFSKKRGTYWNDRVIDENTGMNVESCRDAYHAQFGLIAWSNLLEILYHQGRNLWNYRNNIFYKGLEYEAYRARTGGQYKGYPKGQFPKPMSNHPKYQRCQEYGNKYIPGWYIPLTHYKYRLKMDMPETYQLVKQYHDERFIFHWGMTSVTHPIQF